MTKPAAVQVYGRDVPAAGQVQGGQWRILAIERPELMALAYIYAGIAVDAGVRFHWRRLCL